MPAAAGGAEVLLSAGEPRRCGWLLPAICHQAGGSPAQPGAGAAPRAHRWWPWTRTGARRAPSSQTPGPSPRAWRSRQTWRRCPGWCRRAPGGREGRGEPLPGSSSCRGTAGCGGITGHLRATRRRSQLTAWVGLQRGAPCRSACTTARQWWGPGPSAGGEEGAGGGVLRWQPPAHPQARLIPQAAAGQRRPPLPPPASTAHLQQVQRRGQRAGHGHHQV
jgi:hypothetical protein